MSFLTSKFSGWLSIVLLVAVIGGGWYMYQRGVTFGELEAAAKELAQIEQEQKALAKKIAAKEAVIANQVKQTTALRQQAASTRQDIREALNEAPESYIHARNTIVPKRLRFGPSSSDNGPEP